MVENHTLIDKVAAHPRIFGITVLTAALMLILSAVWELMPHSTVEPADLSKAPLLSSTNAVITEVDESTRFGLRNTFARFIPTGSEYYYYVTTDKGAKIFVRADKNWAEDLEDKCSISGTVRSFSEADKRDIREGIAMEVDKYADLITGRLCVLRIIAGMLLLIDILLAVLMIKEKISADTAVYKITNAVFCILPVAVLALGIYLFGYI